MIDLKEYMDDVSCGGNMNKEWTSIKKLSAENMLQRKKQRGDSKSAEWKDDNEKYTVSETTTQRKKPEKSAFLTSQESFVGGGSDIVLNALAAYLRYLEGTSRDEYQEYVLYIQDLNFLFSSLCSLLFLWTPYYVQICSN